MPELDEVPQYAMRFWKIARNWATHQLVATHRHSGAQVCLAWSNQTINVDCKNPRHTIRIPVALIDRLRTDMDPTPEEQ